MPRRQSSKGYTLIEILIVMVIISIVASVALLKIGHNQNRQIESFANELTQRLTMAEEQAMLQPNVMGLMLADTSYQFSTYQPPVDKKKNEWIPLQDKLLGNHAIPHDIEVGIEIDGKRVSYDDDKAKHPQVIISTNGEVTPFTIYVGMKGKRPRYAIKGDADGKITRTSLS